MNMTGKGLARLLELEYRCERCKRRLATKTIHYKFVCYSCYRVLERKLVRDG